MCLLPTARLRTALSVIENSEPKICFVLSADEKVIRTITDGDVRRFLLAGGSLDDPLSSFPKQVPVTASQDSSHAELLELMDLHSIQAILILDENGAPVDVRSRSSIDQPVFLSPPHIGSDELGMVKRAFLGNWIAPAGPNLNQFEENFSERMGRKHALAVSSGTAALHLALRVLDVKAGDRVYVSDLTFVASLQPILYQHAIPVLIDSEPVSWNMSPLALERKLLRDKRSGTLPAAIVIVHLYGQPADIMALTALAELYGVPVIEDAAESLGATVGNKPSGAHGLLSAFSFNGNKIITTSGGGALVTDRQDLIDHARNLSTQGRDNAEHYQHSEIAYNYRMSNVLAGIGLAQLDVLEDRVKRRREIFYLYQRGLSKLDGISFQGESPDSIGCRWLTVINLDPNLMSLHPYQLMRRLRQFSIETRPAWKPMHMQPLCRGLEFEPHNEDQAVSSALFLRSLCLPSGSSMSDDSVSRVVDAIHSIIEGN